jgi:uncharacterized Ntn-hydrolase superfamily protein
MTYSIVAVDTTTGEVGGAGTSCLAGGDVFVIYRGVPGRGVVHAQARYSASNRDRAAELLSQGSSAADTLNAITSPSFDANVAIRQYGVVDLAGQALGYTGSATMPFAADRQGSAAGFAYSAQGNILTSAAVLDQAAAAFEAEGCDLAERLLSGLLAGARGGQGDSRCTGQGIPADSAFLQVERPAGNEGDYLALRVESSGADDPLPLLEARLNEWRSAHPCPAPLGSAGETSQLPRAADDAGCTCHATHALRYDSWVCALFGLLLVVARRRRRTARQVRPAALA